MPERRVAGNRLQIPGSGPLPAFARRGVSSVWAVVVADVIHKPSGLLLSGNSVVTPCPLACVPLPDWLPAVPLSP